MNIIRQGVSYLLVGLFLVAVDWLTFVLLTWAGVSIPVSNIIGRIVGALLGFVLNGHVTFRSKQTSSTSKFRSFVRFMTIWLLLTSVSTYLMNVVSLKLGVQLAWLAKPVVEGLLAIVGFMISRQWIYC